MVRFKGVISGKEESRPESELESRLGSQLAARIMVLLKDAEVSKGRLAAKLGHKTVSGELKRQIGRLQELGLIEMTIPAKPNSRLQKYKFSAKGRDLVEKHG